MPVSSRAIALAVVGLLVAAGAAFAIGRASAGDGDSPASEPAGAPEIEAPAAASDTPTLRTVGAVADLKEPPPSSSGGSTASPDTGSTATPDTGSSPPTGTGVPSTPPSTPVEPNPVPPPPDEPAPPPPPPGEG